MEPIFEKTEEQRRRAEAFAARVASLCAALEPYSGEVDTGGPELLLRSFRRRTEDFFRENRRFTLAVAGRVKAGKSTFLNTLLFGGREVLPKGLTPKTAVLTRMEYAEEAALTARFLTRAEWEELCRLAGSGMDTPQVQAAQETAARAGRFGTPLEECFAEGTRRIPLEETDGLEPLLNDYVGEGGRFAPAVNSLTLGLPLDSLRDLAVVDTPGLNDPVLSRTEQTRRCLETCDAIFFLSRCGSFLDRSDLDLLTAQLPQKGAAELVLAATQFDSALIDMLPGYPDLESAARDLRGALQEHAARSVGAAVRELRRAGCPEPVTAALERCRRPVFLSSLAEDLAHRPARELGERERLLLRLLGEPGREELERIGNFEEARAAFFRVAAEKDDLLRRRAGQLTAAARGELGMLLERLRAGVLEKRERLLAEEAAIGERQRELSAHLVRVRADVDEAFAEYLAPLEQARLDVSRELDRLGGDWAQLDSREGVESIPRVRTESAAQPLRPWTWGRRRTIYTSEQRTYAFLDPADARRNLEQLWLLSAQLQAAAFLLFADTSRLQNRLMEAAAKNFPLQSPARQPERLRSALRSALSRLPAKERPQPDRLLPEFSLPKEAAVRDAPGRAALREAAQNAARKIVGERRRAAGQAACRLREQAAEAAGAFSAALCGSLLRERDALGAQSAALERECGRLQTLAELLRYYQ
ncbi:dynamin family protein [Anaerotruncus massiliensis (ex Liu et al. 2021)]|uniref:dynamin family protein n=1 Tax=Anaerotruncus massiliensis (ex Liu et al. 2021) TaxID=2321404 RepID=UPI003AF60096